MNKRTFHLGLALAALSAGSVQAYEVPLTWIGTNMPPLEFHGFASQGFLMSSDYNYLANDTKNGSIQFTEIGLNVAMNPFPRTRIAIQGFDYDLGNTGQYDPFLDYASIEYTVCDQLVLHGGRIRRADGIYNAIQDIDLARTFVLLPQGVYDPRWRDVYTSVDGGSISGDVSLAKAGSFSYEVYAGMTSASTDDGGLARNYQNSIKAKGLTYDTMQDAFMPGVQAWWNTPLTGLRVGANYTYVDGLKVDYHGGPKHFEDTIDVPLQQYSIEYVRGGLTLQAEYASRNNIADTTLNNAKFTTSRRRGETWYVAAAYRWNKWFETGVYYSEFYWDAGHKDGANLPVTSPNPYVTVRSDAYQDDLALALRFDPKPWWVIKVEGHWDRGTALIRDGGSDHVRNGEDWFMLAVKNTFSF